MNITRIATFLAIPLLAAAPALGAALELVDLAWGYDAEDNVLGAPVFEGASAPPIVFETLRMRRDPEAEFVRRIPGGFVRPLKYDLAPSLDLGALLTTALRAEASTLGLRSTPQADAVVVGGELFDPFLENRGVFGGAILFYSYFAVDLELRFPDGRTEKLKASFHDMVTRVNGGFGAKDEAGEATARLLVNAAQEIAALIARNHLKAPVQPAIPDQLQQLLAAGADGRYPTLKRIGLSGLPAAGPALFELAAREKEEDDRAQVIGALANLRDPAIADQLAARYREEDDEDSRFQILKAIAYARGPRAAEQLKTLGLADKNTENARFARFLLDRF
jgi:hypothetical protein